MSDTLTKTPDVTTQDVGLSATYLYIVTAHNGEMAVYKSMLSFDELKAGWAKAGDWYTDFSDGLVRINEVASVRPYYAPLMDALEKVDPQLATDSWHAYAALRSSLMRVDGEDDYEADSGQFDVLGGGESYRAKA